MKGVGRRQPVLLFTHRVIVIFEKRFDEMKKICFLLRVNCTSEKSFIYSTIF